MNVLARYSFFLFTSARPAVFLIWLIVPGIVYAWLQGKRQLALQAALLLGLAACVDTLGVGRGLKAEYFIFTDPLIIIAGAVLLDALPQVASMRWAYLIGLVLSFVHFFGSQPEPFKMMSKVSGPGVHLRLEPDLPVEDAAAVVRPCRRSGRKAETFGDQRLTVPPASAAACVVRTDRPW